MSLVQLMILNKTLRFTVIYNMRYLTKDVPYELTVKNRTIMLLLNQILFNTKGF